MKSKLSIMLVAKRNEKQLTKKQTAVFMETTPMYQARFENNNLTGYSCLKKPRFR